MRSGVKSTFKEWYDDAAVTVDGNDSWNRIGEWVYPSKENGSWQEVFFHLCEGSWQQEVCGKSTAAKMLNKHTCFACDAEVPEGIKMIMLLGKL